MALIGGGVEGAKSIAVCLSSCYAHDSSGLLYTETKRQDLIKTQVVEI